MNTKTRKITLTAILAALYLVLSFFSIDLRYMKISLAGLPVCLGAFLCGPLVGFEAGFLGAFLEQLLRYGFSATTLLWILPPACRGLLIGWYVRRLKFNVSSAQTAFILFISAILLTILNTIVIYLDSRLYGYYSFAYVFGNVITRIITGSVTALLYWLVMPPLLRAMRRFFPVSDISK